MLLLSYLCCRNIVPSLSVTRRCCAATNTTSQVRPPFCPCLLNLLLLLLGACLSLLLQMWPHCLSLQTYEALVRGQRHAEDGVVHISASLHN
jgi:hypothetical protein